MAKHTIIVDPYGHTQLEDQAAGFCPGIPAAKISHQQFVELPRGIVIKAINSTNWVFEALWNVYGGKGTGQQWYLYLKEKFESVGFKVSVHNKCMFFRGNVIYCLYTGDSIIATPTDKELDNVIKDMKSTGLALTVEGFLENFLGVHINTKEDGTYKLSQQRLIDTVIQEVFRDYSPTTFKNVPMALSKLLSCHLESQDHDK
jgi:Reverse transcriptase (RNA-dependent DNA polymerase)